MYYTYIVSDGPYYKIGITSNVKSRMSTLQTGNASCLHLCGYIEVPNKLAALSLEAKLHNELAMYSVRGEWFNCSLPYIIDKAREQYTTILMIPNNASVYAGGNTTEFMLAGNGQPFIGYVPQELPKIYT